MRPEVMKGTGPASSGSQPFANLRPHPAVLFGIAWCYHLPGTAHSYAHSIWGTRMQNLIVFYQKEGFQSQMERRIAKATTLIRLESDSEGLTKVQMSSPYPPHPESKIWFHNDHLPVVLPLLNVTEEAFHESKPKSFLQNSLILIW